MPKRKSFSVPTTTTTTIIQPKDWATAYNGYGYTKWDTTGVRFAPKASTNETETHACLILSNTTKQDFTVKAKAQTISQLREKTPNPWECFWFIFNYAIGADGKKIANYIVLKPNGVEVGTMNEEVGQKFLFTASTPTLKLGVFNYYQITKVGKQLSLKIDGATVVNQLFEDLYDHPGTFGLYSEDADCLVESVIL